ncbi:MAG: hypothetical protein CSA15_01380 [Candidatus Delongbacteria bacterium]|nr:MAG: hypothetical protein CSA15_01380 [Candidatus Delongbacteria bacterium]
MGSKIIIPKIELESDESTPTISEKIALGNLEEAKEYILSIKDIFPLNTIDLSDIDIENLTEEGRKSIINRLD